MEQTGNVHDVLASVEERTADILDLTIPAPATPDEEVDDTPDLVPQGDDDDSIAESNTSSVSDDDDDSDDEFDTYLHPAAPEPDLDTPQPLPL